MQRRMTGTNANYFRTISDDFPTSWDSAGVATPAFFYHYIMY